MLHTKTPTRHTSCIFTIFIIALMSTSLTTAVTIAPEEARAEQLTLNSAINKAGRQRMLSQRMAKAYCQIGVNTRREEATAALTQSVQQFETQLAELKEFAPTKKISEALSTVQTRWTPFKTIVLRPYSKEGVAQIATLNEELLQATHRVTLELQEYSGVPTGRLVNIAGRQRMLSQRLAKFYMLRQAGLQQADIEDNLDQVYNEFGGALNELRTSSKNTPEINKRLSNVNTQWELLKQSLKESNKRHDLSELVVLTTDKILQEMDVVTALYETTQ